MIKRVIAKLGTMRKTVDWIVYPQQSVRNTQTGAVAPLTPTVIIQSDRRICAFDPSTGRGILSADYRGANFAHLNKSLGATDIVVPPDVIMAVLAAQPKSGDSIGPGVYVA